MAKQQQPQNLHRTTSDGELTLNFRVESPSEFESRLARDAHGDARRARSLLEAKYCELKSIQGGKSLPSSDVRKYAEIFRKRGFESHALKIENNNNTSPTEEPESNETPSPLIGPRIQVIAPGVVVLSDGGIDSFLNCPKTDDEAFYGADATTRRTYLEALAQDGHDGNWGGERLMLRYIYRAHFSKLGVLSDMGDIDSTNQSELRRWLQDHPAETSVTPSSPPRYSPSYQAGTYAPSSETGVITAKMEALKAGDTDAINGMIGDGVRFDAMDLNTAVWYRVEEERPELVRAVIAGGATCPEWLRSSIKDPELLEIIDAQK